MRIGGRIMKKTLIYFILLMMIVCMTACNGPKKPVSEDNKVDSNEISDTIDNTSSNQQNDKQEQEVVNADDKRINRITKKKMPKLLRMVVLSRVKILKMEVTLEVKK